MAKIDPQVTPEKNAGDLTEADRKAEARAVLAAELNKRPALKKLIIGQGVVLILMAMFTVGALVFKGTQMLAKDSDQAAPAAVKLNPMVTEQVLAIRPAGAMLKSVSFDGDIATFLFDYDGDDLVIRYDLSSGSSQQLKIIDARPDA